MVLFFFRIARSAARPPGRQGPPVATGADGVERPSIVNLNDLKEFDNLENDADEGWAGVWTAWFDGCWVSDQMKYL